MKKIDHVGIAVKDLNTTTKIFEKIFNTKTSSIEVVKSEKIKTTFLKIGESKIELLEEANFYTEEVRRIISDNYGYDNLYKGGLSIRTPMNSKYQKETVHALRKGLESYDKRHGWRGPITNINSKNWKNRQILFMIIIIL